jgi:hypothetical protein
LNQVPILFSEDFRKGATIEGVRFVNPLASGVDIRPWIWRSPPTGCNTSYAIPEAGS